MSPNVEVKTPEEIKTRRVAIDAEVQAVRAKGTVEKDLDTFDEELYAFAEAQVLKSLIEAKMWYGKMLEGLGMPFPAELADKAGSSVVPTGSNLTAPIPAPSALGASTGTDTAQN